ncbi:MAG: cation:proton antiporter [Oscillospiraceae bacterium]|jgi:Kef-type K+ transport system membrane component KefB|nr:cation:proton antiporter [Oscillospiraceae bacterium]
MSSYKYLLDIAIILLATKALGLVTRRIHLPQVVGALLAGLLLGPAVLGLLTETDFLSRLSEIGVIVIMFAAGLETDLKELVKNGKAGFLVALLGVLIPLAGGTAFGFIFNRGELADGGNLLLQHIFLGTVLTATSVSITVEALKEMGKLNTKVGSTILAAALIDDVLGLICLTIVSSFGGDSSAGIGTVLLKIALFLVFSVLVFIFLKKFVEWYSHRLSDRHLQRFPILAFACCLLVAFCAERFFGVADITGAYVAGITFGATKQGDYIDSRVRPISYMLLTPIFFASVGMNATLDGFGPTVILAAVVFVILAVLTKLLGCGIGAKLCGMSNKDALRTGLGMACRGEVALIVTNKGKELGLVPDAFVSVIIIMVVCTAILTPVMLKLAYRGDEKNSGLLASGLVDSYETPDNLEKADYHMLQMEKSLKHHSGETSILKFFHRDKK